MSNLYGKLGINPAFIEAGKSKLPGLTNGPGDAYRHVIGAAELTRRHGEATARVILEGNELSGDFLKGQKPEEKAMDRHNNEIGIEIGRAAPTYDDVVQRAREKIDSAVEGNEGPDVPTWLPKEKWGTAGGTNWPPDWEQVEPIPESEKYEYGDEEHRYPGWRGDEDFEETGDPLARPVETWSEEDVNAVMKSDAYWRHWDPDYEAMHKFVDRWHERYYGNGPVVRDAQGRINPIRPIPAGRGGGPVQVRAHDRAGGKVAVRSHERSRPG
ncbi:MAG: hypothetical protein A3G73_03210 [Rhodospirillales bacterium RIFCSPLOWO2_12_FULL_67_15]|nr:MAG: hypothetical protein A3G73_03210 [Rhodospirillales bacterium RIFCSPLOWO2_12_FULL_67_15]